MICEGKQIHNTLRSVRDSHFPAFGPLEPCYQLWTHTHHRPLHNTYKLWVSQRAALDNMALSVCFAAYVQEAEVWEINESLLNVACGFRLSNMSDNYV